MMRNVVDWINKYTASHQIKATVHSDLVREEDRWIYIPVHVDNVDAFDQASRLQEIEDAWNNQTPSPDRMLMLVPTKG